MQPSQPPQQAQPQPQLPPNNIIPRFLSIPQAAQYAGMTISSVRRLISTGQVRAAKMGRRLTIRLEDLDALWQKRAAPASLELRMPEPMLLDIKGAARMLNSTVWNIRTLVREGRLPKFRLGKKYLCDPADLRTFVAEGKERQQ